MKQFSKIYVEITNICNLSCSFCPKTPRKSEFMSIENFKQIAKSVKLHSNYIYLHIKGEPMLHPNFSEILKICKDLELKVCLTTNGTLLEKYNLNDFHALHKLHISLHSYEANEINLSLNDYIENIIKVLKTANFICVLRLWNTNGFEKLNSDILNLITTELSTNIQINKEKHTKLRENVYLEYGDKFDWPDLQSQRFTEIGYCYALKTQIGILVSGDVVPCCLDNNGDIILGNIFENTLEEIWHSPKSQSILKGFSERKLINPLCQTCGFITRFNKEKKALNTVCQKETF